MYIYGKLNHFAKQAEINSIINQLNLGLKNKTTTKKHSHVQKR